MRRFCALLGVLGLAFVPSSALANSDHSHGNAGTSGTSSSAQPLSHADQNSGGANGQCPSGTYCSTRHGAASLNGNGNGKATGKPCAGCVGKADNKNPHGQAPSGPIDHNAGYECDRNHGIGRTNPAHTGCNESSPTTTPTTTGPPNCASTSPPASCNHSSSPPSNTTNSVSPASAQKPPATKPVVPPASVTSPSPGTVKGATVVAPTAPTAAGVTHGPEFVSSPTTPTSSGQTGQGTLPFTGLDLGLAVLVGCLMIGAGLVQRRATSSR